MEEFKKALVVSVDGGPDELVPLYGTRAYFGSSPKADIGIAGEDVPPRHGYLVVREGKLLASIGGGALRAIECIPIGEHLLEVRLASSQEFSLPVRPRLQSHSYKEPAPCAAQTAVKAWGAGQLRLSLEEGTAILESTKPQSNINGLALPMMVWGFVAVPLCILALFGTNPGGGEALLCPAGMLLGAIILSAYLWRTRFETRWKRLHRRFTSEGSSYRGATSRGPTLLLDGLPVVQSQVCLWEHHLLFSPGLCGLVAVVEGKVFRLSDLEGAGSPRRGSSRHLAEALGLPLHVGERVRPRATWALVAAGVVTLGTYVGTLLQPIVVVATLPTITALIAVYLRGDRRVPCEHHQ